MKLLKDIKFWSTVVTGLSLSLNIVASWLDGKKQEQYIDQKVKEEVNNSKREPE